MTWRVSMVVLVGAVVVLAARTSALAAAESAQALADRAVAECHQGRDATDRQVRKEHFERGQALAERALALDDKLVNSHFGIACNLGELLRLDGEKITSVFGLRRLMSELDKTLALDANHVDALATKGVLLMRLPRMFGGNPTEGERMLRKVVQMDDHAVTSRITLARACGDRGDREEALGFATRALQIAREQGRADKVAQAQATLDELQAAH